MNCDTAMWPKILSILERFGFPTVVAGALMLGMWGSANWVANNVLKPLTIKHMETMAILQENTTAQTKLISSIDEVIKREAANGHDRMLLLQQILESQNRTVEGLDKLLKEG